MHISWFTVVAQIINFFILVWLLRRYLYRPILKAIDEREKRIASQLNNADEKKAVAEREQDEFRRKNETFDQEKSELMTKAIAETKAEREKLFEKARNDANDLHAKLEKAWIGMDEDKKRELTQKTQQEVIAISRKVLNDLASVGLEEQSADIFIRRLKELKEEERKQFVKAFKADAKPVLIRSAFDLSERKQTEIRKAVSEITGPEAQFQFTTTPELITGIELIANGYKLAWNISAYLDSIQKTFSETMKEKP
jgi:F-type H+-transporting ATPase subunit b